jgi:hypothetical protein
MNPFKWKPTAKVATPFGHCETTVIRTTVIEVNSKLWAYEAEFKRSYSSWMNSGHLEGTEKTRERAEASLAASIAATRRVIEDRQRREAEATHQTISMNDEATA